MLFLFLVYLFYKLYVIKIETRYCIIIFHSLSDSQLLSFINPPEEKVLVLSSIIMH